MNSIIYNRLRDICPDINVMDLSISEVEKECHVGFEIIGYKPQNLSKSVEEVYVNEDIESLWEFIYHVWEVDK